MPKKLCTASEAVEIFGKMPKDSILGIIFVTDDNVKRASVEQNIGRVEDGRRKIKIDDTFIRNAIKNFMAEIYMHEDILDRLSDSVSELMEKIGPQ